MGKFEDKIRQPLFKNEIRKAVLNVMYTANWIRDNHAFIFKEYGILQQHYNVLRIVKGRKGVPVSPGEIIEVMIDKGRDLTRLVDKLVDKGYLERSPSQLNRRKVDISITKKGIKVTKEIESKLDEWINSNIRISDKKAKKLNAYLDLMRNDD